MKWLFTASAIVGLVGTASAEQADMTDLTCKLPTKLGVLTWEFYDNAALRYYGDGSVSRLTRIGVGAYERYDREGEWAATYYFFDSGEGIHMRVISKPGFATREQNRAAPLEKAIVPFTTDCGPISDG